MFFNIKNHNKNQKSFVNIIKVNWEKPSNLVRERIEFSWLLEFSPTAQKHTKVKRNFLFFFVLIKDVKTFLLVLCSLLKHTGNFVYNSFFLYKKIITVCINFLWKIALHFFYFFFSSRPFCRAHARVHNLLSRSFTAVNFFFFCRICAKRHTRRLTETNERSRK